jgi:hypothetical protein
MNAAGMDAAGTPAAHTRSSSVLPVTANSPRAMTDRLRAGENGLFS